MASTSFNPIQSQAVQSSGTQPLALKQGQVFHGTIKQLYPDQMAEVQVGGNRFFAKLEVPLKAGDSHYFQVTNMNPQPELKVVTGPMQQGATQAQQLQQLMSTMNLPKSSEIQQILGQFIRNQIPISKDQLLQAEQWMKNLPDGVSKQDAISAMQRMAEMKMPFSKEVFQAIILGQKNTGITANLDTLTQLLAKDTALAPELRNQLLQQIEQLAKPFDAEAGGLIVAKATQTLLSDTASISDKLQSLNILKEAGVVPAQANLQNALTAGLKESASNQLPDTLKQAGQVVQTILTTPPEQKEALVGQLKTWLNDQSLLSDSQKQQLKQLVERFEQLPATKQTLEIFAKQMHTQLVKAFSDQTANQLFTQDANQLSAKEHLLSLLNPDTASSQQLETLLKSVTKVANESTQPRVQQILSQTDLEMEAAISSKAMEHALKSVLKGLGISYEAALSKNTDDTQALAHQLKPHLLQALQEQHIAVPLKESAEALLARMNGMQLLSGENGHQHQIIMQVPMQFFGKQMDATLQWNGRMKDDGKLDASYARILFYLQMESMQETVIDMQVQNRIVTVTVFNNEVAQLDPLAEPLTTILKAGLAEKEYHLSGVSLKAFEKPAEQKGTTGSKPQTDQPSGVDIRI